MVAHAPPRIIGHRGAKGSAPENTLASICAAKAQGCAWVEVDVMLSKDKFLVLYGVLRLKHIVGKALPTATMCSH